MWTNEEAARELLAVLPLISRIMAADFRQEAGEDTTMPQFRVLSYLNDEGTLTLSEIARRRHVSLQSAGGLVQSLVDRGWVQRAADPSDRRQMLLSLTDVGQQQFARAHDRMIAHLSPLMDMLSTDELSAVQIALEALQRVLTGEEMVEGEPDDR